MRPPPACYSSEVALRLQLIGGGRMGEALLGGLLAGEWAQPGDLAVVEMIADRRAELSDRFGGVIVTDHPLERADAVLAVKPDDAASAGDSLREAGVTRVLSIAAGVTTASLESVLGEEARVVRAMPNTPALVGAGAAAIAPGRHAAEEDLVWASGILEAVGTVVVCEERMLDAVTGLSGSGPAYVFWLAETLTAAGVEVGLSPDMADALTRQTLLGAARLLTESGEPPADLRAAVTSPGGTTARGIAELEARGAGAAFIAAVAAATERSRELGAS
ncbi:MAG: pyrroline-5-carboxylate reductase [bacterium]|nr:pyrroline-5-carboxylate reductase [bacterium]MDE0613842.1 pyrroline-5-carboxylate reductase [bacterium]MYB09926.1 pyrroline-5-carboxylate reductase [Acidimicrobiia bacterium]MYG57088.1 pyrroline-5-carboxylate reductase [Acidimicrobiia bacterium]MYJ31496.1 pyrroline-5-carboxylate reductase [Acidimicrobiia bacterium]